MTRRRPAPRAHRSARRRPRSQSPASRSPGRRSAVRALLATALVGVLLAATGAGAGASTQQEEPDEPEAGAVEVALVDQTPWVRPGEQLRVRFRVEQAPIDAVAQLRIHDDLVNRADVADTIEGDLGSEVASPPSRPLDEIKGADGTYELTVAIGGPDGIGITSQGAYPVELRITDAAGTFLGGLVTYLLIPGDFPPLDVAVVMEIGGPPGLQPDGTVQPDDATVSHVNARIETLKQAPDVPLTVAPVPETLDALGDWGEQGGQTLDRLREAVGSREVLSRPYVDLDLDALVAAGLLSHAAPEAVTGAVVLRDRLHEPLARTWLTGPTVGDAEVDALRDLGIARVLLPESAVEGDPEQNEGPVPVGPVDLTGDGPVAGVSDDALASRLLGTEGALDVQRFLAELTLMWLAQPSIADRAVVVRIPADAPVDPSVLAGALRALTDGGAVRAIGLDDYFALPPVGGDEPLVVERTSDDTDGASSDLRPLAPALENGQRAVSGLAATLDDRDEIQSLQRSLLISLATELTMAQRRAYVNRIGAVVNSVADGINAPPEFTITLTARTGTIPLTIDNRTDQSVSVDVLLQSNQLEFPDGDDIKVNVPPGGRRIDLKVRTRTSGAFPLHITLASPDRSVVYDRTTFTIRSTAVSGVGLVLSVGAGAFLLLWWARHWRTARRSRRLVDDDASGPGTGAERPGAPVSALAALSSLSATPPPPPPPVPPPPAPRGWPQGWTGYRGTTPRRDDPH